MAQLTPMMLQYLEIHDRVKDAILFFRLGDFYEMFFDDALTASRELEITLTARDCGLEEKAPMCGVPYHAAENYIVRLIEKGYKVAICEQVEDAKHTKGIVKRDIVRIISPGTINDGKLLESKNNNYLMSIYYNLLDFGIAIVDVSTGEFRTSQVLSSNNPKEKLLDEIAKYNPSEIIVNTILFKDKWLVENIEKRFQSYINIVQNKYFNAEICQDIIKEQFQVYSMTSLGIQADEYAIKASGALITYLNETQMRVLSHINKLTKYIVDDYMAIDISTRRNLELTANMRTNDKKGSLLDVLDNTQTSMGGRKLKNWIHQPLISVDQINDRLAAVQDIVEDISIRIELGESLKKIYDLERLMSKISFGNCNARDFLSLKCSLDMIPSLKRSLLKSKSEYLQRINEELDPLSDIKLLIDASIHPDAPIGVKEGNLIKDGYHPEVDYYRNITTTGKDLILDLEMQERENTGIKSLKIKFNKIFGYYIDVTKSNLHLIPDHYIRKQTLANSERFYIEELKEIENKILNSEDKIIEIEYEIFQSIRSEVLNNLHRIKKTAERISIVDVLYSFAKVSYDNDYVKPAVHTGDELFIIEGRHPVVESMLSEQEFVPNSVELNCSDARMLIITGPNMAGKSTFIRQVAIITLMAQIGCFVPAKRAKIGIVDRIFTRVGASDDLALGHSTFMVEMSEVSNILKNATAKSLIILDEIGRGTSTFDGLSIAWSVVEYVNDIELIGAKTLFATHYHELTQLESLIEGVKNYCIKVQESEEGVIFLRKIIPGSADQSYGIEVAKLAGLPQQVVTRAREILNKLESNEEIITSIPKVSELVQLKLNIGKSDGESTLPDSNPTYRSSGGLNPNKISDKGNHEKEESEINQFNYLDKQIIQELKTLPVEEMSPIEVMNFVYALKKRLIGNPD